MTRQITSMSGGWENSGVPELLRLNEEIRAAIAGRMQAEEDRHKTELLMRHAQKLASIGILAEGVAHEFSNILTVILGHAELARISLSPDSPVYQDILAIEKAGKRAAALSKRIMNYAEDESQAARPVDFSRLVREIVDLTAASIGKYITLDINLAPGLPPIEAVPAQLRQLVVNIVLNASEAIVAESGCVNISTGLRHYDANRSSGVWFECGFGEGACVYFEVADTGCGMDEETIAKIFSPFFSTKSNSRGSGLAAVLGVVQAHKGAIRVDSVPGKGTTFTVIFPVPA